MTTSRNIDITVLSRDVVRRTAHIMGPASAAARALAEVRAVHNDAAEVCKVTGADTLLVVPHADLAAAGWTPDLH